MTNRNKEQLYAKTKGPKRRKGTAINQNELKQKRLMNKAQFLKKIGKTTKPKRRIP